MTRKDPRFSAHVCNMLTPWELPVSTGTGPTSAPTLALGWCCATGYAGPPPCPGRLRADRRLVVFVGVERRIGLDRVDALRVQPAQDTQLIPRPHGGGSRATRDRYLLEQQFRLTGRLQRTLRTANIIENLNGGVERYTRNVKR